MRILIDDLIAIHKILSTHLLYPILLSTLLAMVLFSARVLYSETFTFRNLVWNLYLAWLPYVFSLFAAFLYTVKPKQWWWLLPLGFLWLLFFPNAPYIVTDFLHLEDRPGVPLWYDIILLATFAWTGCFLAIASLRTMQILVKNHLGWFISWLFAGMALTLGGLGIYLGRFSRFNSWDMLFQPKDVLFDIAIRLANPLSNLRFFGFTLLFTAFLLVCYLTFISVRRVNEP